MNVLRDDLRAGIKRARDRCVRGRGFGLVDAIRVAGARGDLIPMAVASGDDRCAISTAGLCATEDPREIHTS